MRNFIDIKYLVNSEEPILMDLIAQLGSAKIININECSYRADSKEFLENVIIPNMFFQPENQTSTEYLFKNKYLYYLSGGAIGYLDAIYSMDYNNAITTEIENIKNLIGISEKKGDIDSVLEYDFVSIGSAEGNKDMKIIKGVFLKDMINSRRIVDKDFNYYPVDISPILLQLNINKFTNDFPSTKYPNFRVHPINLDFLEMKEEPVRSLLSNILRQSGRPKIFMLLGGTVGNYREDKLIDCVKAVMTQRDKLVISFELYNDNNDLQNIVHKYFTSGNVEFLSNPIKLIPHLRGFLENKTKYFDLYSQGFSEDDSNSVSIFAGSRVYKPTLKIPILDIQNYVIAWTTRYKSDSIKNNIESLLNMRLIKNLRKDKNMIVMLGLKDSLIQCPDA